MSVQSAAPVTTANPAGFRVMPVVASTAQCPSSQHDIGRNHRPAADRGACRGRLVPDVRHEPKLTLGSSGCPDDRGTEIWPSSCPTSDEVQLYTHAPSGRRTFVRTGCRGNVRRRCDASDQSREKGQHDKPSHPEPFSLPHDHFAPRRRHADPVFRHQTQVLWTSSAALVRAAVAL